MRKALYTMAVAAMLVVTTNANALPILVATTSGQYNYLDTDTPWLFIHNPTAIDFTGATLVGKGYQGLNLGVMQTAPVFDSTIAAGTTFSYRFADPASPGHFCGNGPGLLFVDDYDDSYGCSSTLLPGNVEFTFTAMWDGNPIFAVFSPTTNDTGGFVGFLGLDPDGRAETPYDAGGVASGVGDSGILARIFIGTPPVPEPAPLALMGLRLCQRRTRR